MIRSVAIVGGGFSGALLAINLLRHERDVSVLLIERRHGFGRGVAYSASHPGHLLNVRAANMSALPDDPGHFARWFEAAGGDAAGFARRSDYGRYLSAMLAASAGAAQGRLQLLGAAALAAEPRDGRVVLRLDDGRALLADALALAMGNMAPTAPPGIDPAALPAGVWLGDPWGGDPAAGLRDDDDVLLLGTGLTMVDAALTLAASGWRGRMLALSRRGLLPHPHAAPEPKAAAAPPLTERPRGRPAALLRGMRERAAMRGWRAAVDELRPFTQGLWAAASARDRAQFLRHLRPWWDVHRHRLAPQVADRVAALVNEGRLRIAAGKPLRAEAAGTGARLAWRPRGGDAVQEARIARIVNCIGPSGDVSASPDPLLRGLLMAGLARPDAFRLGLDVDAAGRLVGADGRAHPRLWALGPMTRGAFWEITAVPDIRQQAWALARRLCDAHWVGGEL